MKPKDRKQDNTASGLSNWPGAPSQVPQVPQVPKGTANTSGFNPTGFGPGMGPDLETYQSPSDPVSPCSPTNKTGPAKTTTDSQETCKNDSAVVWQVGELCPHCGFAKLYLDPNDRVSCPVCGFGAMRGCG